MDAPSALDEQPWQFVVITDPEQIKRIPEHHNHSDLIAAAPAAILICGDRSLEKLPGFWIQDCAASAQNLLLAAHGLGLGAVWIGVYPTEANVNSLQQWLKLPDSVVPFALIAIGHPDEALPDKVNFKPERVHWNCW
jgi:nitroreductase